jgi:hypothetical protein
MKKIKVRIKEIQNSLLNPRSRPTAKGGIKIAMIIRNKDVELVLDIILVVG